jgi:hypothetical protein
MPNNLSLQPASDGLLLELHFDPECRGNMFLRNVGIFASYTPLRPRMLRFSCLLPGELQIRRFWGS